MTDYYEIKSKIDGTFTLMVKEVKLRNMIMDDLVPDSLYPMFWQKISSEIWTSCGLILRSSVTEELIEESIYE